MGRRLYSDIAVRGVTYVDARAAARALGVTPETVRTALRRGTLHRLGTGAVGREAMMVQINGRKFANAKEAGAHFGVTPAAIIRAINEGRTQGYRPGRRHKSAKWKPVTFGTLSFSSMSEADRVLGFKQGYVSKALRRKSKAAMQRILGAAMAEAQRRVQAGRRVS